MHQSEKASLRHFFINNSNATINFKRQKASWLTDGLAAMQSLKSKDIYGEWIENPICFITPPDAAECLLVGIVNDAYQEQSTKNNTQEKRGEGHTKTAIEGFEQHMPAGMKWNEFLRNAKNKEEFINIIMKFIKSNKDRQLINSPFIVTAGEKFYEFQEGQDKVNKCNHEEADTRIILLPIKRLMML